jgi:hypothetical protein
VQLLGLKAGMKPGTAADSTKECGIPADLLLLHYRNCICRSDSMSRTGCRFSFSLADSLLSLSLTTHASHCIVSFLGAQGLFTGPRLEIGRSLLLSVEKLD